MKRIGLISDSHGKLDDRVFEAFEGVDEIIHAGDICDPNVLYALETIAPVTAVLGNCDGSGLRGFDLPDIATRTIEGRRIVVVHDRHDLGPVPEQTAAVVFGHSHMPLGDEVDGVLWVNPGSAQQARRSPLGRSVAIMHVSEERIEARIVPLDDIAEKA